MMLFSVVVEKERPKNNSESTIDFLKVEFASNCDGNIKRSTWYVDCKGF